MINKDTYERMAKIVMKLDTERDVRVMRCPDCGERGERKGHMECQYPAN